MKIVPCTWKRVQGYFFEKITIIKYLYLQSLLICVILYNRNVWGTEGMPAMGGCSWVSPMFCILVQNITKNLLDFLNFCLTNW